MLTFYGSILCCVVVVGSPVVSLPVEVALLHFHSSLVNWGGFLIGASSSVFISFFGFHCVWVLIFLARRELSHRILSFPFPAVCVHVHVGYFLASLQ